jgi:hypothetical protein
MRRDHDLLRLVGFAAGIIMILGAVGCASSGAPGEGGERFRGRLLDAGGAVSNASTTWVRFELSGVTSDDDIAALARVLAQDGQDAVISAMRKLDSKGWMTIGPRTRIELRIVREIPTDDGGRRIRLVTDRPIHYAELIQPMRSRDYPFGIVELELAADGTGSGSLIAAAQAKFHEDGTLEVKSLGNQPFRLVNIAPES